MVAEKICDCEKYWLRMDGRADRCKPVSRPTERSGRSGHGGTKFSADSEKLPFNPFPKKPWVLYGCSTSLFKTLWEKEKLLVTSNFSFSHSGFYLFGKPFVIFIKFEIVVYKLFQFGSLKLCCLGKG